MIGEDDLLQELKYRRYACETLSKCILGFLSNKNYHLFFDKINRKKNSNIISFLYKVNYLIIIILLYLIYNIINNI